MVAATHTDLMHYESRAIKQGLQASITRLAAAKGYVPPSLTPAQVKAHGIQQDWSSPRVVVDFHKNDTPGSGDPSFDEMRSCLLLFEAGAFKGAGSKERAFYSALRTLLGDITVTKEDKAREMQIVAAYKWFSKHRPRGYSEDPAVFAAMAASLSLKGVQQPARHTSNGGGTLGRPFAAQGTKHEFFAIYSKEGAEGAAPPRPASSELLPAGPPAAPSAPFNASVMPVVMHPSVPCSRSPALAQQLQQQQQQQQAAAAAKAANRQSAAQQDGRPASQSSRAKGVVFGPADGQQQQQQQQQKTLAQQQQPWTSGPFKDSKQISNVRSTAKENEEMDALRRKWGSMDSKSSAAVVDQQVQQWSLQRARLEEEIIRRQEASRYASPSMHVPGLPLTAGQQSAAQAEGYMSPYAHLISDQMGMDNETGDSQVPGLMMAASVTSTARDVKAKAQEQHAREVLKISRRLAQLGLQGRVNQEAMEHALAPVPDKAYLECLAKLPRPGDLLPSKPVSARTAAAKARVAKKRALSGSKS